MPKIYILHVHPDPNVPVKRRTYTFNCTSDNGCTAVGAQRLSVGFGGPWQVLGRPAAWPVLFDGNEIGNPFDVNMTVPVGNACAENYKATYVIRYDYISSKYQVSCGISKQFYNGNVTAIGPGECFAIFPHIIGYNQQNKPIWRTELDVNDYGHYYGASKQVGYRGSAGPGGIAIDYKKLPGWYPEILTSITTVSKIMIGRQKSHGSVITQTRYYSAYEDGKQVQKPYIIQGPSVRFSEIVSNINISLVAKQPAPTPPGPTPFGTVIVTTWHGEGYVVGAQVYSMNYGPVQNNMGGAIGLSRCSFVSAPTTHALIATIRKDGLLLFGTTNATVKPFEAVDARIDLEEMYFTDNDVYAVTPVQYRDETGALVEGYGQIDIGMTVSHLGLVAGSVGTTALTDITGQTLVRIKNCIGTSLSVIETLVGGEVKAVGKVPRALQYVFHEGFGGKLVILPWKVERIMTKSGWMEPHRFIAKQRELFAAAEALGKEAKVWGDATVSKLGAALPLLSGEGINAFIAQFMLDDTKEEPETPEDPENPDPEQPRPERPPDKGVPFINLYNPSIDNPGPIDPYFKCTKTITPGMGDTDDPIPEPDEIVIEPDPSDPDPEPIVEKTYSYTLESQAMLLGHDYPKVCRLYAFGGIVSGKKGEVKTIGYYPKSYTLEGIDYMAEAPLGILGLDETGSAVASGAVIKSANSVEITIGTAATGTRIILMGEFNQNDNPPDTGKVNIHVTPDVEAAITIKSFGDAGESTVYSGTGPTISTIIIPGNYTVYVTCPGYTSGVASITVIGGETTDITIPIKLNVITKKYISFNVSSTYSDSDVYINGKLMQIKTPFGYGVQITGYTVFSFVVKKMRNNIPYVGVAIVAVDLESEPIQIVSIKQIGGLEVYG